MSTQFLKPFSGFSKLPKTYWVKNNWVGSLYNVKQLHSHYILCTQKGIVTQSTMGIIPLESDSREILTIKAQNLSTLKDLLLLSKEEFPEAWLWKGKHNELWDQTRAVLHSLFCIQNVTELSFPRVKNGENNIIHNSKRICNEYIR